MEKAHPIKRERSEAIWRRAMQVIPSGTQTFSNAPNQYVNGVAPKYIQRGHGGHVWDVDGNEYIDYGLALGPVSLGHAYPRVNQAIMDQLQGGISLPLLHPLQVDLSELLVQLIPCAEMVRFGKNGSDVTAATVRLARAYTRRDKIACCGYHGWQDWYIGSTSRNLGVPQAVRQLTLQFQYNDLDSLKAIFNGNPGQVAAVIMEPTNFFEPRDGFLEEVRELAHQNGALLIFDEVITGFRMSLGGAQEYFQVTPDLAAFGKSMANGMPLSTIVGKAEIMRLLEEVFFSFTFGGETLSLAASMATIQEMQEKDVLQHIWAIGQALKDGYNDLAAEQELTEVTRCIGYGFWPEMVFTNRDGQPSSLIQTLFTQEIIKRGILTRPGMFVCYSHTWQDVAQTLLAYSEALEVVGEALRAGDMESYLEGDLIGPVIRPS